MDLPADTHVHTEWSWDARLGSMERSCAEAVRLGLPGIAFTEHLDHTVWTVGLAGLADLPQDHPVATLSDPDGRIAPPPFDVTGYFQALDRCRTAFPDLAILSGLEVGEPHWHSEAVGTVLASGTFDRVIGSLHCLPEGEVFQEPNDLYAHRDPGQVMRDYLAEIARLVIESDSFAVLGHIDYPVRSWPTALGTFNASHFEQEFRHALRAIAEAGRALEINTVVPLQPTVLRWWYDEGGGAVTFGSDAHDPSRLAHGLVEAASLARAHGFRPARNILEPWPRS